MTKEKLSALERNENAKEVSLAQLHHWLKENCYLTWHHGSEVYGKGGFGGGSCPVIKYIEPSFDTRTMQIYHLTTEGVGEYCVDFREEFNGTILDLLKYKIENKITLPKNMDSSEYIRQIQIKRINKEIDNANINV